MNRKFLLAGVLTVALGPIALFVVRTSRGPVVRVTTSAVTEGPITRTVMTSGTLAPAKTIGNARMAPTPINALNPAPPDVLEPNPLARDAIEKKAERRFTI